MTIAVNQRENSATRARSRKKAAAATTTTGQIHVAININDSLNAIGHTHAIYATHISPSTMFELSLLLLLLRRFLSVFPQIKLNYKMYHEIRIFVKL